MADVEPIGFQRLPDIECSKPRLPKVQQTPLIIYDDVLLMVEIH